MTARYHADPDRLGVPTEGKHTPGPWECVNRGDAHAAVRAVDYTIVADVREDVGERGARDRTRKLANARLIAAAPTMLAALKLVLGSMSQVPSSDAMRATIGGCVGGCVRCAVEAALAEAES